MPKRRKGDHDKDDNNDDIVPIPIQFFFWNQTSLFIKQKFGPLTEAHALNFERVIVQNILHGLSPGLSDAINSISRWAFIKASFPHIIHACSSALVHRRDNNTLEKLNKTETKLLYTLHWLILDAASECNDNATQKPKNLSKKLDTTYLHSVATVQLFVYLFIPILKSITPSDLDNLKLSNGLQIWEALWSCRQPNVTIFNTPVKLNHEYLTRDEPLVQTRVSINKKEKLDSDKKEDAGNFGQIYMGSEDAGDKSKQEPNKNSLYQSDSSMRASNSGIESLNRSDTERNSKLLNVSSRIEESDSNMMSQISDFEGDTIRDSLIVINEIRRPKYSLNSNHKAPLAHMSSICSISDTSSVTLTNNARNSTTLSCSKCNFSATNVHLSSGLSCPNCSSVKLRELGIAEEKQDQDQIKRSKTVKSNERESKTKISNEKILDSKENLKNLNCNVRDATYFDIAVMRCLLSSRWHADSYLWCLDYLSCRVVEITDFTIKEQDDFYKINSLSIPANLNDLCVLMGVGSVDLLEEDDCFQNQIIENCAKNGSITNEFLTIMNQIYLENDLLSKNQFNLDNMSYFAKRKKYESSFQTRISADFNGKRIYFKNGRIKYIDDDFQSIRKKSSRLNGDKSGRQQFATTPFTKSELENLNENTKLLKDILKKDFNCYSPKKNQKVKKHSVEWPKDFEQKFSYIKKKIDSIQKSELEAESETTRTNLDRAISFSDSNINYQFCYEQFEEAAGSTGLINTDGSLNLSMILKGVHSVLLKENCLKLCDLSLNILENLISIDILPSQDIDDKLEYAKKNLSLSPSSINYLDDLENKYNESYYIAADLALRNIKWLGCINCQTGSKSFLNDQLRGRVKLTLGRLFKKNRKRFESFFRTFIEKSDINHIMETFHALFGYCNDPLLGYGHYYPHVTVRIGNENLMPQNLAYDLTPPTGPDGTAFNIDAVIIEITLKPLVDRLLAMRQQLSNQENLYLFSDVRSFLSYIKENHGNVFRKLALASMLDPHIRLRQELNSKNLKLIEIEDILVQLDSLREIVQNLKPEIIQPNEDENLKQSSRQNTENNDSKRSSFRNKHAKMDSRNNLDTDQNESSPALNENLLTLETLGSRRGSEASFRKIIIKKFKEHKKPSLSINDEFDTNNSKLDEDRDDRSLKATKKDIVVSDSEILNNLYEQAQSYRRKILSQKVYVDSGLVFKGLEYYRFLMECLPPASLPDVPFMSALLDLEAPILAKASFLIETAYFVNRCNRKDWPEWIKMNISMCRPYGSFLNNKNLPNTLKRNKVFQLAAANIFSAWGEVLAIKLEEILSQKENDLCEMDMKPDDYFDDRLVNPNGNNCPFGLINIVCLLLLEITKFLRETYQHMPKKINNIYSLRHDVLSGTNFTNSSMRFSSKDNRNTREQRVNLGSVFSNESSQHSITKEPKAELSAKVASNDNISGTVCHENDLFSEGSKHISFNLRKDTNENKSLSSSVNRIGSATMMNEHAEVNDANRLSGGAVISKTGTATSQENIKSASVTHIGSQKRNSVKRRPSLKYRDRSHRMNTSSSFVSRKLSHCNSQSDDKQDLEHSFHLNPNSNNAAIEESVLIIAEENSLPSHSGAVHFSGVQGHAQHNNEPNFECEVDEADFNRCFPWIKIVVKLFSLINFNCAHFQSNHSVHHSAHQSANSQIQIKTRRNLTESCHKDCYLRLFKNGHSLIEAVLRLYETSTNLSMFQKYKKQTDLAKSNKMHTINKSNSKQKDNFSPAATTRKNSQSSFNSQKMFFINNILKKNHINKTSINSQILNQSIVNNHGANATQTNKNNMPFYETLRTKLERNKDKIPTCDYIYNQVHFLNHIPLQLLCKSLLVMSDDLFVDVICFSWNLLLNSDQEISSSAAVLFLIGSIKQPNYVEELMRANLRSKHVETRFRAILKFEVLWKFRYHVWPRLEANANTWLKISPPCIEFVLPSPPIGISSNQPVDPPWMPRAKTKVEEVTINQGEVKAVVTASKSRKKHQQEILHKALEADKMNKRMAREMFNFTDLNYLQHASFEPFMHQSKEESEEDMHNEEHDIPAQFIPANLNMRKQSVMVFKRLQQRNSVIWNRKSLLNEGMEENAESGANVSALCDVQQSQAVFPTAIGSAVLCLVDLLFDHELNTNNQSIASLTHRIVWTCLTEDAALFLRYFFEKITQKDKKNYLIQYLKRLLSVYIELPPQTAYVLFNYLLGVIMFFVRTSSDTSQEAIASIQTIIWRIATYVNGIVFKDLKQTLRKEQCDPSLLVTANVPSAKKLIVHGPDLSQIPNQFPIYDNTQFSFIIQESFGFFKIPESKRDRFYLFDIKTNQIHLPDTYVRNFYFFRRNFYPQLSLVEMDPKEAIKHLEKAAFNLKVLEQSKVLFFRKLLENTPFNQVNATAAFLHDELLKLPMFPRKALEADFNLYSKLSDRELLTTDMLHKYSWCQLIWSLFSAIDNKTASTWDITLFISVVNGSFVLHSEDMIMIRTCLAIYINSAQHFQHIFATNGFLLIMPTLLKVYSNMQANPVLKNAIEFCSLQFYTMHRIPFILQMFGSVAQILELESDKSDTIDTTKVHASALFNLLLALESNVADNLRILELVKSYNNTTTTTNNNNNNNNNNISDCSANQPSLSSTINQAQSTNLNVHNVEVPKSFENMDKATAASAATTATTAAAAAVHTPFSVQNQFSSPASLLTNAGSSAAVLAVSGISATNLLITSSGALGIGQLANLTNLTNKDLVVQQQQQQQQTGENDHAMKNADTLKSIQAIKTLDFCYQDDQNIKFNMIDSINLCVTVIAYATHTTRASQMLNILNVIVPRYVNFLKEETEKLAKRINVNSHVNVHVNANDKQSNNSELAQRARNEFVQLQKICVSLKTLVHLSDYLTRVYSGPRNEAANATKTPQTNVVNSHNRSPSIIPDEDSMRFGDDKRKEHSDDKQVKQEFRIPRDSLLNVISEFVFFASKRIKQLYKLINDSTLKVTELLDTKAHCKLVEIAHTLLKLWDDSITMAGHGLQNYFQKLLPVTNWSQEELKPAFNNLLRRIDRLFTKILKRPFAKRQVDWTAVAGLLNGLYLTLDRQESIANFPYFKMLINSTISLVLNDSTSIDTYTTGSIFSNSGGSIRLEFQLPIIFSKSVIRIVGKYITLLKDQSNLEQLFGSTNLSPINPSIPTSLAYLLNFLLPLLFWSASDRKDSPRLNSNDLSFVVNMILNALKPPSKLAATLLLQAPKQHHLNAFDTNPQSAAKSTKQMKDLITQSTYLTLKLLTFSFTKLIDLIKIATTIRQICFKCKNIYLWKFLDFVSTNRTPLFLLLKPFIENFVATQTCESELESQLRHTIQNKLNYLNPIDVKCTNSVLDQLIEELNTIKLESNGDLRPDKEAKLDAHEDNMLNVTKYEDKSASMSSPGRNLAFKFNRAKKDSTMTSPSSSMNSTPRKKFEKLNYKSGADILDIYKAKLKAKQMAKESEKEMENLTNINLVAANESNEQKFSFVERESALRTDEPFRPRPSMSSMSRQSTEASSAGLIDKTNEQNSEPSQTETSDSKSNDQTFKQNKKLKSKKIFFV